MKAGWEVKPLGEVCEIKPPKKLAKTSLHEDDLVSFAGMSELGELRADFEESDARPLSKVYKSYTYFADGDVLIAKITPCFENGKMGIARNLTNGVGFGSSEFVPLRTNDEITPEFLFYFLLRDKFRKDGTKVMSGAVGHKRVPHEYFSELLTPIPPLEEQKRIVAVLDAAFEGLTRAKENAETNLQNARELFEASVTELIETTSRNSQEIELGDLIDFKNGFAFKSTDTVDNSDVQLLRMGNLYQNQLDLDRKPVFYPASFATEFKKFEIVAGDLVMSLTGTMGKEDYGFAVMIPETDRKILLNQRIAKIEIKDAEQLEISYLLILMRTRIFLEELYSIATGTRQANLSTVQMKKLKIKVPDIQSQRKIAGVLDVVKTSQMDLTANYQTKLSDIADLRQTLLQKAFAGELT